MILGFGGPGLVPLDPAPKIMQNAGVDAPVALMVTLFMSKMVIYIVEPALWLPVAPCGSLWLPLAPLWLPLAPP